MGSSTAGSHHVYLSDMEDSIFLKRIRRLYWGQMGLSVLIFGVAVTIIACEAVPLHHYNSTSEWAKVGLALWPLNFDLRPTIAALSCGCIIAFLDLVHIVSTFLPSPHSRIKMLSISSSVSSLAGFITALTGVLFMNYLPLSSYPIGFSYNETLNSWTCKWKGGSKDAQPPIYFAPDCAETHVGFVLLGALVGLELLMGVVAAVSVWSQTNDARRRADEGYQLEKLEFATKQVFRN